MNDRAAAPGRSRSFSLEREGSGTEPGKGVVGGDGLELDMESDTSPGEAAPQGVKRALGIIGLVEALAACSVSRTYRRALDVASGGLLRGLVGPHGPKRHTRPSPLLARLPPWPRAGHVGARSLAVPLWIVSRCGSSAGGSSLHPPHRLPTDSGTTAAQFPGRLAHALAQIVPNLAGNAPVRVARIWQHSGQISQRSDTGASRFWTGFGSQRAESDEIRPSPTHHLTVSLARKRFRRRLFGRVWGAPALGCPRAVPVAGGPWARSPAGHKALGGWDGEID